LVPRPGRLAYAVPVRPPFGGVCVQGQQPMSVFRRVSRVFVLAPLVPAVMSAQAPQFSDAVRAFIRVQAPVVVLTDVRVIDGTGAPARPNQTLVIRDGVIAAIA